MKKVILFSLLFITTIVLAQNFTGVVSGTVIFESDKTPIPGATVVVKGTTNGTITNIDGKYSLSGVPANGVLVFGFPGCEPQEIQVKGRSIINVALKESSYIPIGTIPHK
ncbi:carboxypeptidase-like regulatory domain-containing protein [Bacteroides xylanisolvens]|uniref:carboxypeptidase-like regulatory domain-containing protein n=1 Tax=Bacteroides xylanisolvens TaxID=371601 RepID=UPI0018998DF3|nr:carboxypeptidase-like regulatory domain-containing protein [Bacteroides xylanisolvens]